MLCDTYAYVHNNVCGQSPGPQFALKDPVYIYVHLCVHVSMHVTHVRMCTYNHVCGKSVGHAGCIGGPGIDISMCVCIHACICAINTCAYVHVCVRVSLRML